MQNAEKERLFEKNNKLQTEKYWSKMIIQKDQNDTNGRGTQIFWFLETSIEVDNKIPKLTN